MVGLEDYGVSLNHIILLDKADEISYSLRSIILFVNIDVFRYILIINTSVLAKSNMSRREYP
jgi:hypothetical protein